MLGIFLISWFLPPMVIILGEYVRDYFYGYEIEIDGEDIIFICIMLCMGYVTTLLYVIFGVLFLLRKLPLLFRRFKFPHLSEKLKKTLIKIRRK